MNDIKLYNYIDNFKILKFLNIDENDIFRYFKAQYIFLASVDWFTFQDVQLTK